MYNNYFSNFDRPLVPDDLCKDSAPRHPRFWRRKFLKVSEKKSFEILNIFPYKCMGPIPMHREIYDPTAKRSNVNVQQLFLIATLVDLLSSMIYANIQPQGFLGSGEEDF